MADFTESSTWVNAVYQLATTDPLQGGASGKLNEGIGHLVDRTAWLRAQFGAQVFSVLAYGAVGDDATDDAVAIQAAATAAGLVTGSVLYFPPAAGYRTSTTITVGRNVDVVMDARLTLTAATQIPCLVIGEAAVNNNNRRHKIDVARASVSTWSDGVELWYPSTAYTAGQIRKVGFRRYTCATSGTSASYPHTSDFDTGTGIDDGTAVWNYLDTAVETAIGVKFFNPYHNGIDLVRVAGFTVGAQFMGDGAGCSYNNVNITELKDNKIGLDLTNKNVGWCNENLFVGGRFWCASTTNVGLDRYGVRITSQDGTYDTNNNNVFLKPSWEVRYSASINGGTLTGLARGTCLLAEYAEYTTVYGARVESTDYAAQWRNASEDNKLEMGFPSPQAAFDLDYSTSSANVVAGVGGVPLVPLFAIEEMGYAACLYNGTDVFVPGMSWTTSTTTTPTKTAGTAGTHIWIGGRPWTATTAYVVNDVVQNDSGKLYTCVAITGAGNSAGSGGPTGTGTGIVDNEVTWDYTGLANALGISTSNDRAPGVVIDTTSVKDFLVMRDGPVSARGGRVHVICYDAAGNVLTGSTPAYVRGTGSAGFSTAGTDGNRYITGSDSTGSVEFSVRDEVKSIWVGFSSGSKNATLRGFKVFARTGGRTPTVRAGYAGRTITRRVATQAPTGSNAGAAGVGDQIWNDAPVAGGPLGWVCVVAGTPGTWKEMAPLSL